MENITKDIDNLEKEIERKINGTLKDVDRKSYRDNVKTIVVDIDKRFDFLRKYNDKKVSEKSLENNDFNSIEINRDEEVI